MNLNCVMFHDAFAYSAGRLLRAFNLEFSWFRLAAWINVTEQWPYRLSWIILEVEDDEDIESGNTLKCIYDK